MGNKYSNKYVLQHIIQLHMTMDYPVLMLFISLMLVHLVTSYNSVFNGKYPGTCIGGDFQKVRQLFNHTTLLTWESFISM